MGAYYARDGITIYHGDCREIVPSIPPRSVDLVLTDPPFFMPANVSNCRKAWRRSLGDTAIMAGYFRDAFDEIAARLKSTGGFYTFSDATSYAIFLVVLYPVFDRTQAIVWDKQVGGMGNGWRHSNELIIHGAFKDTAYAPGFRRDVIGCRTVPSGDRYHQSEKPSGVLSALLGAHPVGVVLDPFMGGGSTLRAAKDLGWRAIGCDIDERNCEEAARRMEQGVLLASPPPPAAEQATLSLEE